MIRRLMCALLTAALLLTAIPASALGAFDLAVFDMHDYVLEMREDDFGFININEYVREFRDFAQIYDISHRSSTNFSYVYPYIYVKFSSNKVTTTSFKLMIELASNDYPKMGIHTMEFIVDGQSYMVEIISSETSNGTKSSGAYYELFYVSINGDNRALMDAITASRQPVKVIAYGAEFNVEFTMEENIITTISDMYDDYVAAGGIETASRGNKLTILDPLTKFLGEPLSIATPLTDHAGKTNAEWLADGRSRALLAATLAYDLFTADPACADVLGYAYGDAFVGTAPDGAIHMSIQTVGATYYFVRSADGTTVVSVKAGTGVRLTNAQLTSALNGFCPNTVKYIDDNELAQSIVDQAQLITTLATPGTR